VCFEEPSKKDLCEFNSTFSIGSFKPASLPVVSQNAVEAFFQCQYPFVVVGALNQIEREAIQTFLIQLKAPVYFEAQSGLREESSLKHLRIESIEDIWTRSRQQGYPIDGVLRIGSVPTARFWRDLEETNQIRVYSISENPFTGISEGELIYTSLLTYFQNYLVLNTKNYPFQSWKKADQHNQSQLLSLFAEEPSAEPSLIHFLSKKISAKAKIYIGNSLPIREWDQASDWVNKYFQLAASRGANGIDGQLSTFLGFASQEQENWAILGDLTTLYDLVAPWIMNQIQTVKVNVVVINNGGGQIFASKFAHPAFLNEHQLNFKPFADFWGWHYECWHEIPSAISNCSTNRLIELIPNNDANQRFHKKKQTIK
jgi:2-succinyl-5-enolpyruvyl-6-hydroxy-3-cyclohexene-1-carboxylate synthase